MIRFEIDNIKFKAELDKVKKSIEAAFDSSLEDAGNQILREAKAASSGLASISNSIALTQIEGGFEVQTGVGMDNPEFTAYYEFGTGNYAAALVTGLPDDWREMAKKYFINGKGTIPAQPYLYPAFQRMQANIEKVIIDKI